MQEWRKSCDFAQRSARRQTATGSGAPVGLFARADGRFGPSFGNLNFPNCFLVMGGRSLSFFLKSSIKVQTRATCQPAHTKPPKWRCSPTTSAVEGVVPSHPPLPLASSRDDAKALALLHAMMVIHRRSLAALARDWRSTTSVRALALASCRKNACVSSDHLPPTSQARTTSLARPKRPVSSEQLHPPSRNVPVVTRHVSLGTPVLCRLPTGAP